MMRGLTLRAAILAVIASVLLSSAPAFGQSKQKRGAISATSVVPQRPTIWRDPGAVESLDFVNGPGAKKRTPKPPFTFVEEDKGGTSPKVKVKDAAG